MLLSAENESDLTRQYPRTWQPEPHGHEEGESFPSTVVLGRTDDGSELATVVLREWSSVPHHRLETSKKHTGKTLRARICGNVVALGGHDAATRKTLRRDSVTTRAPPVSANSGRAPTAIGSPRPTPPRPCRPKTATNESLPQNDRRYFFCATVADRNQTVWLCRASSLLFGMATEVSKPSTASWPRSTSHGHRDWLCPKQGGIPRWRYPATRQ